MWKPLKSWMVHSDPIIEWYYTLRAHKIKIRRKSNKPYKRRNHWDWWWNESLECHGKHTPLVSRTPSSKNCSIFGWWQSISQVASSSHSQGTCTSSDCSSSCMSLLCTILHYWITARCLWHECMFQGGTAIWRSTIALNILACHEITSPSSRTLNHSARTGRMTIVHQSCVHPMMVGVVFHHCILLVRITLLVK
jgi:hypothetical protein